MGHAMRKELKKNRQLYLMCVPAIIFLIMLVNGHWCYSQLFIELGDVSLSLGDNLYIELCDILSTA